MKISKVMYVPVFMIVLSFAVFSTLSHIGCGASIEDLKIDDSAKVQMAIESGCAAATAAGCFNSSDQCVDAITDAVDGQKITPDAVKIILDLSTCEAIHDAMEHLSFGKDDDGVSKWMKKNMMHRLVFQRKSLKSLSLCQRRLLPKF
jgi:hypothetical protein